MVRLKRGWHRREWDCNPADPTTAVSWTFGSRWLEIQLLGIWDVEARITVGRYRTRQYAAWWAIHLFDWLESKWEFEQSENWDPNP